MFKIFCDLYTFSWQLFWNVKTFGLHIKVWENKEEAEEATSECKLLPSAVKDVNIWLKAPSPFSVFLFYFGGTMFLPLLCNKISKYFFFCWMRYIFHHAVCENLKIWWKSRLESCIAIHLPAAFRYTSEFVCLQHSGRFTSVLCWGDKRITLLLAAVRFMSVLQSSWD